MFKSLDCCSNHFTITLYSSPSRKPTIVLSRGLANFIGDNFISCSFDEQSRKFLIKLSPSKLNDNFFLLNSSRSLPTSITKFLLNFISSPKASFSGSKSKNNSIIFRIS